MLLKTFFKERIVFWEKPHSAYVKQNETKRHGSRDSGLREKTTFF